jgi:hypothetical protein
MAFATAFLGTGCASESEALGKSMRLLMGSSDPTEQAPLRPGYRYLRASVGGRTVLLALGYVENHPGGAIEVWYSGEREVVKIQRGHIVGTAGLATDWRSVRFVSPLPELRQVTAQGTARYMRSRDEMPGYRYDIRETMTLRRIPAPEKSAIRALDPALLVWIEESSDASTPGETPLPPARFALDIREGADPVVYSEQCLTPTLCLALQRWPVGPVQ